VIRVGPVESTVKPDNRGEGDEKKKSLPRWILILSWSVTTFIAFGAVAISFEQYSVQRNQIAALQRTTPSGEITSMIAYRTSGSQPTVTNMRNDPVLRQQTYYLSGTASDIPDNGSLFMVVHEYNVAAAGINDPSNHYYITAVSLGGKSDADQYWKRAEVYIGENSTPKTPLNFRVTLYFCDSIDAEKITKAISSTAVVNYGLPSLPYPSCKQLDSIFVMRA
jgi:hypothetical protein